MTATTTNPARYCIECKHAFQVLAGGEFYCRLVPMPNNPVTGKPTYGFCESQRADADKCGAIAKNFEQREADPRFPRATD